jgi:drug/metabolite transporter (DMT)-like permease
MELIKKHRGKILMFLAAFLTATGQLFWKLGYNNLVFMIIGFFCYGIGAIFMVKSLTFEKLSVAYPILCLSYVFALTYGDVFLGEQVTFNKIVAVGLLIIGVTLTSYEN